MTKGERLTLLREKMGLSQTEASNLINVSKQTLYKYENDKITNIPSDKIEALAKLYRTTPSYIMGWNDDSANKGKNSTFRIPVLANVAAGIPIEAIEDIVDWEESNDLTGSEKDYFGLKVKGDSMEPRILNGDTLIVRKQPTADSGQTVVVLVNGDEGCVKKLKWTDSGMMLISNNTSYDPMFFTSDEIENLPVRIVGRVVEVRSKLI